MSQTAMTLPMGRFDLRVLHLKRAARLGGPGVYLQAVCATTQREIWAVLVYPLSTEQAEEPQRAVRVRWVPEQDVVEVEDGRGDVHRKRMTRLRALAHDILSFVDDRPAEPDHPASRRVA